MKRLLACFALLALLLALSLPSVAVGVPVPGTDLVGDGQTDPAVTAPEGETVPESNIPRAPDVSREIALPLLVLTMAPILLYAVLRVLRAVKTKKR